LDSDERVAALVGHGLQVARDTTVGLGELGVAEAAGDLLLDFAHAQVPFGAIVGEGDVRVSGEQQHGAFMFIQALPQVMGVGLGDPAPFAVLFFWGGAYALT